MYSRCCVQQAGRQERLRMCIDEKEAPIGYIAVAPERWIRDGIAGCVGCAYAGQTLLACRVVQFVHLITDTTSSMLFSRKHSGRE